MAKERQLHSTVLDGFWADVGQPADFLVGSALYLASLRQKFPADLATSITDLVPTPKGVASIIPDGYHILGNVLIDPTSIIGPASKIGPNVVIGPGVIIGVGARLSNCVVMASAIIKDVHYTNAVCLCQYEYCRVALDRWKMGAVGQCVCVG